MADMNVVPYIDVMLVLLVIFMVTAPMMQTGVELDLPNADTTPLVNNFVFRRLYLRSTDKSCLITQYQINRQFDVTRR